MPRTLRCDHPAPPLMSPMGLTREGGEEPHRRSRRCDMRPTEWHRINSIVAPTIVVGNQTGTFDLLIPKPASSVSDSDKTPGFSGFWVTAALRLCFAGAERTRFGRGITGGTLKSHVQPPKSRHARRGNPVLDSPQRTREESASAPGFPCPSFLTPSSLVPCPPSSGRIF